VSQTFGDLTMNGKEEKPNSLEPKDHGLEIRCYMHTLMVISSKLDKQPMD
jgi:hypothetical protein